MFDMVDYSFGKALRDEVEGADIDVEAPDAAGQALEGQLVYSQERGDHLNVNGIELFKPGFGGRIVPTKRAVVGQPASFQFPQQPILESPFHDPAAEDVKRKAAEEKLEEHEMLAMALEEKSRRDEQQVEVIDVSVGAADAMQLNAEELASSSNRPMQSSDVVVDSVFDDDNADTTHVRSSGTSVVIPPQVGQSASDSTI
eukprot:s907_g19.t1